MFKYPVYKPFFGGNEKKYVNNCLDSTWISSKGEYIKKFELGFSEFTNIRYGSAVCNGTVALHLAMLALGIGPGDEVIVPTFTYIASVNAITYVGAKPVFVDSLEETWQINPHDITKKITEKTKALICVHLYGHPCNMKELKDICTSHDLFLIEDCAEAIGSEFESVHVGGFGDIATFSFYGNKTITTGEGGMVLTNDETIHERVEHFKGQGLAKHRQYWHDVVGYNYRMTNIAAAIGFAQLEIINNVISKKRQIAEWYIENLADCDFVIFHKEAHNVKHTYWMCSLLLQNEISEERDNLRDHLNNSGIETRPLFYPVHTMPMYSQNFESHKVAENLARRGINLPSYPDLIKDDISFICDSIKNFSTNGSTRNYPK